ncbi:MAG: hypothetical protein KY410_03160 [Proteobacteria bacterium]|nr:hypothetical protein [Pseudomonadota bacterium]
MKNSPSPHSESRQGELGHYLHERPDLLLKALDIAERCWHESNEPAVGHSLREHACATFGAG